MIEFKGNISQENRQYLLNRLQILSAVAAICAFIFLAVPCVILMIVWEETIYFALGGIALAFLACTINTIPQLNPQTKALVVNLPKLITIENDSIERSGFHPKSIATRKFDEIKKIIDKGNFYLFSFYFPHKDLFFLCQKDLITQGTIEEFEALFADKIVRKKLRK